MNTFTKWTPRLLIAAKEDDLDLVRQYIDEGDMIDIVAMSLGWSSLHYAATNGNLDMVKFLVENGSSLEEGCYRCGWTPLHYAANLGHLEIVEYLLRSGASFKSAGYFRETAKNVAQRGGHARVVKLLEEWENNAVDELKDPGFE